MPPTTTTTEKKGHICPPSNVTHPSGRWESLFVYGFICKFTNLRGKVEGLDTPMDLENALLSREPHPILTQILSRFILNLKPQTRNLSTDQISTTLVAVLSDYFKSSERTVFWNDDLRRNVDPFEQLELGFFATDWDFKLKVLRQLVELQLTHSTLVKGIIDRAWGVTQQKTKKKDAFTAPPDPADPQSQRRLQLVPLGQDRNRRRYWVADDTPRIYVSTNPWKTTATFQTISSTREEYLSALESLKRDAPAPLKRGEKRTRLENAHFDLIEALESRIEVIDTELARIQRVKKKIEQRRALLAQAELRETRTRRKTQRPDYVYTNAFDSQDDADDDNYEDDEGNEFNDEDFLGFRSDGSDRKRRHSPSTACRRSTRTAVLNASNKRESSSDSWQWRGERRSSRVGEKRGDTDIDGEPRKRARTVESTESGTPAPTIYPEANGINGVRVKLTGAAALKPTEIALEQVAGKKKSKYWVYAVEPMPPGGGVLDPNNISAMDIGNEAVRPASQGTDGTSPMNIC